MAVLSGHWRAGMCPVLIGGALCSALACDGGTRHPGGDMFADGSPRVDGASVSDAGSLADALPVGDAAIDSDGPLITITSPTQPAPGDYSSAAIVTGDRVSVRCRAQANPNTGSPVDSTSVLLEVIGADAARAVSAQPTAIADEYEAIITVREFANGAIMVRCTAADTAPTPRANSATIATFLDQGPRINIFTPTTGTSYANQIDILVTVDAAPVAAGDTAAAADLGSVGLVVGGVPITEFTINGNVVTAVVVFDDSALFDPPLDGGQTLIVSAANMRSATPVRRNVSRLFVADSAGPLITLVDPPEGSLVSGIVTFDVDVADPAGVDMSSVVGTIAGVHEFSFFNVGGDRYEGVFDTRQLGVGLVFPTVVVRARDAVGNQSSRGFLVALDNVAPVASLDPPLMREAQRNASSDLECSLLFDPVAGDAAGDGDTVAQLSELRARVEDLSNTATASSGVVVPYAGVDNSTVQLFILDDSDGALIVDTDGDGMCDAINPLLVPTSIPMASNEAAVIDLVPTGPEGSAHFTPPETPYSATGPEAACVAPPESDAPAALCPLSSPGTRKSRTTIGNLPIIYAIPPVTTVQCWGNAFDSVATNIADGPACLAVVASDLLGNTGISPPLRLCFDADLDGAECPLVGLPDCTGTFNEANGTVDPAMDCAFPLSFADDPGFQLRLIDAD